MNFISHSSPDFEARLTALSKTSSLFDPVVEGRAREVIEAVRARQDDALIELTARFDGAKLSREQLPVGKAELFNASLSVEKPLRLAIKEAQVNIENFNRRTLRKNWDRKNPHGAKFGEKFDPIERVGVYVPGGTAPLVSTALMTITLAKVAGCPEIAVCTPCGREGQVNPNLLYALKIAGATEIYRLGGAQAIAALALGTETVRKVQKVFGPGNAYVVAAKRLLFGYIAIDLLPGPSEVLVLADDTAPPAFVAADLLAQAEHGSGQERVWLVSPSKRLIQAVRTEMDRQIINLSRREFIINALKQNGWLIHVADIPSAIRVANMLAPEHCEVMTRDPRRVALKIVAAGAIFIGSYSPTVLGDYIAGPSHVLPTGGAAAAFAGLTVDQFQRRTSVVEYDAAALNRALGSITQFSKVEGLDAHGASASIRAEKRRRTSRRTKTLQ